MADQEAWQELSSLYLIEQDYAKAAFCAEELILHDPHSHLLHQYLAEIRYTQVSKRIIFFSYFVFLPKLLFMLKVAQ